MFALRLIVATAICPVASALTTLANWASDTSPISGYLDRIDAIQAWLGNLPAPDTMLVLVASFFVLGLLTLGIAVASVTIPLVGGLLSVLAAALRSMFTMWSGLASGVRS
ncbi:hypothetical protein [Burkholderia sp. MBR-1]|uniref:hypothetical protein n=1 Tax=Burkholderia sp. MBR-1 TaxID=2732364 RepID=UPI0015EF70FF|nr:hypothetical protein [Burkholderia sp. MBR-1]QMI49912.1 hypothetical protein MBR110_31120 [Burkholderia sp. MBR-1]